MKVGCRNVAVRPPGTDLSFAVAAFYPSLAPEEPVRLGPYEIELAADGAPEGESLPLVVVSHGMGGSPWLYRTLAAHLARAGFVVALPEHPGDNRSDSSLSGTVANLEARPRHLRRVIDGLFADPVLGPRLKPDEVGLIGHSMGGYTALALAGGRPTAFPWETPEREAREIPVEHDDRVKALVLLAPAAVWFQAPGALAGVTAPILMLTAEHDEHTPPLHAGTIEAGVQGPTRIEHQVIAGAGHFSFLSPFPPGLTNPGFIPSQDPEGFDRPAFHEVLNAQVLSFLRRTL